MTKVFHRPLNGYFLSCRICRRGIKMIIFALEFFKTTVESKDKK